jgi:hypothetical protein
MRGESFDMRYEIPFLLVCSVTVFTLLGSSRRRNAQATNFKVSRNSHRIIESDSILAFGQGNDDHIFETKLNLKEAFHFFRRSSLPPSIQLLSPGFVTPRAASPLTERINPQHLKANVTFNRARRAFNALDLKLITSTFTSANDSPPGHARAVNLTADPR